LETDSAWVVILAVSLVTLPLTLLLRRLINRPGGISSSFLMVLPLALPIVAAMIYQHGVLPEVAVLRPVGPAFLEHPSTTGLFKLLVSPDGVVMPYTLTGSTGPWLFLIGISVSGFMLLRRFVGFLSMQRLLARCADSADAKALTLVQALSEAADLRRIPRLLVLPPGVSGAFAVGSRVPKILISADLIAQLSNDELEAILAHEISHIASRDIQVVLVAGLLRDMVAWNPLAHVAFRRLGSDREFEADRRAASLTGKPLAVASSLVRVCELRQQNKTLGRRAVLAFGGRGPLTRRVSRLLALSDSPAPAIGVGSLPYVMAALLAAVLGLQAGARIAEQSGGAWAIVLGAPSAEGVRIWSEPESVRRSFDPSRGGRSGHVKKRSVTKPGDKAHSRDIAPDGTPFPYLLEGMAVREQDFRRFIKVINGSAQRGSALSQTALSSEIMQSWRAVPILAPQGLGSLGLYRIEEAPSAGHPKP
jgi:Zn-dependent protease with chaperone function